MNLDTNFGGTPFVLDIATLGWRQKDDPLNLIGCNQMIDCVSHYQFFFDTVGKRPVDTIPAGAVRGQIVPVTVPQMVFAAPEAIAALYGLALGELPDRDSQLCANPQRIADRLAGRLPRVVLPDTEFSFDYDWLTLRHSDGTAIPLEDEKVENELDGGFSFLYDPRTRQSVQLEPGFREIGNELLLVVLPCAPRMDPYAFAEEWQQPLSRLENEFPQPDVIVPYHIRAALHLPIAVQLAQNRRKAEGDPTGRMKLDEIPLPKDEQARRKGRKM